MERVNVPGQSAAKSESTPSQPPPRQAPTSHVEEDAAAADDDDPQKPYAPGQPKSLAGIATRAFCLGFALALGLSLAAAALLRASALWRLPFLLAALALFHFLEFWTQARYNPRVAGTLHFLLAANGRAYAAAHAAAALECLLVHHSSSSSALRLLPPLPPPCAAAGAAAGLAAFAVGQAVRTVAMAQAGASFNHHVQDRRRASHVLVTTGLYGALRHPSYFGFYWWALGLQLALGNVVCLVVFVVVLHRYYAHRIPHKERFLVEFFGHEYVDYRNRTGTMIPFVP